MLNVTHRQIKLTLTLLTIAGLSMGNESCEQAQSKRVLRMDVEVQTLAAKPVRLPNGEVVDFPYVVNALFYREVMNSEHFVISNPIPAPTSSVGTATLGSSKAEPGQYSSQSGTYAQSDIDVLSKFGLLNAGSSSSKSGLQGKTESTAESEIPACLYETPQAFLGGEMISFQSTWGGGIGIGYGVGGDLGGSASGQVKFEQSKLELGLRADDPLTMQLKSTAEGIGHQNNTKFTVNFPAGANIGLDFFFKTPITDTIRTAMQSGLKKLMNQLITDSNMGTWEDAWESRILYAPKIGNGDTHFAFRGGQRAGVKTGDKFTVTNMIYEWKGAPCVSQLKYSVPASAQPIAEVEVVQIGDNVAVAQVTKYLQEQRIEPGAQVKILSLKPLPTPTPAPKK